MLTNSLNNFTVVCTMSWVSKYVSYYNKPMEGIVVLYISKYLLLVKAFQQVIQSLQMIISLDLSGKQIAYFDESWQLKIIHLVFVSQCNCIYIRHSGKGIYFQLLDELGFHVNNQNICFLYTVLNHIIISMSDTFYHWSVTRSCYSTIKWISIWACIFIDNFSNGYSIMDLVVIKSTHVMNIRICMDDQFLCPIAISYSILPTSQWALIEDRHIHLY